MDHRIKPGSPGDILEHHGVLGMRWGVRKEEESAGGESSRRMTPQTQQRVQRVTRTDRSPTIAPKAKEQHHGLTSQQKMLLTFGAVTAAAAGYYAYQHYTGNKMPGLSEAKQEVRQLRDMKLPAKWDVKDLRNGPISKTPLGHLAGNEINAKLFDTENLVINTSRGYADILPKGGFDNPFAAEQHGHVIRALEEMRNKYPSIRNMNIEVIPMSHVPGVESSGAQMCVQAMRAGEARVMYNDLMDAPTAAQTLANRAFLPGMVHKDYAAYHEMGHLLAVAHGALPPTFDLLSDNASPTAFRTWQTAEPLLHKQVMAKHGFTFEELSKLSGYAATEPAEAVAELAGHYFHPEMRKSLTRAQIKRAEAMFNEMGGVTR